MQGAPVRVEGGWSAVQRAMEGSAQISAAELDDLVASVVDAMHEGVAICDHRERLIYVNAYLCHLLGRSREELMGKSARAYLGELYASLLLGAGRHEVQLTRKGGERIVVEVATQRLMSEDGKHLASFALLLDITARARAEEALRRSESDLKLLSAQLWAAQEHERKRIARELHDGIGQTLGAIKFGLENCAASIASGAAQTSARDVEQLAGKIQGVLEEVRRISMGLRPSTLDDLGILATIGWFSREFRDVFTQFQLETMVSVREDEIASPVKTAMYRIVQEATNNIVRHSRARRIWLTIQGDGQHVELQIRDDGRGFDVARGGASGDKGRGLGLTSMRERAEASGGRLRIESESGVGTIILVTWPSQRVAAAYAAQPHW